MRDLPGSGVAKRAANQTEVRDLVLLSPCVLHGLHSGLAVLRTIWERCSQVCVNCRNNLQLFNGLVFYRGCPECRVKSTLVAPSKYWVDDKRDKQMLMDSYKAALRLVDNYYCSTLF